MYLKEISISGFKSFADKLNITLDGKITAIVGPNGSGKSNVVDAVRWVLGEQSIKSLRGEDNMTDVIFSGSKSRNALNVASVTLTFDNSDHYLNVAYDEIAIKRRVYRTGDNEYFLNGEKCRLKDITDLLIDSAVGRESFNIISQGEIQKILSNSPNERRLIFENAAGVLKYKRRKEEALRKLDKAEANLERILDIINEIENSLKPLEEQSEKASLYVEIKEELENIEIALLASEIDDANYNSERIRENIAIINNEILNLNVLVTNSDSSILTLKSELTALMIEIKGANDSLLNLTKEEERLNGEIRILKERTKFEANDSRLYENISNLKDDLYQTNNNIEIYAKEINLLESELSDIRISNDKVALDVNATKNKKDQLTNELNIKRRELFNLSNKIESLSSFVEQNANMPTSIKAILNNQRLKGIHNVLASLINVNSIYAKALEVALISSKNFIVVDDELVAKSAISYLKENHLGRATFFPINVIKPKGIEPDLLNKIKNVDGYIDIFINLVSFNEQYYNVVSNQLGNIIVVKDIDIANKVSNMIFKRYKVVTLDGDIINVGGSISGGSIESVKSIISQRIELEDKKRNKEEIRLTVDELLTKEKELDERLNNLEKSISEIRNQLFTKEEIIKSKKMLINNMIDKKTMLEGEINSFNNIINSSISKEEEILRAKFYDISLNKEKLIRDMASMSKKKDIISSKIEELEAASKINNQTISKKEKELKQFEIEINKLDIMLDNYLKILNEEYSLTFEKARNEYLLDMDKQEARILVNDCKNKLKNIGMVNVAAIEEYKKSKDRYDFLCTQRNDLLGAKETLKEIIIEMDQVMKTEFLATFEKVREEFKNVFKELFSGGSADLRLTDKSNILETGIEIVASPPGKTLKSISLLSGGEMTLTAISLIFAILNVRRVPFCIFDEVEAALDEANVDNFGHYLDHYKDKTQFLIITHKKKTMEYANTLYGITMQESGVSKLVGVKLDTIK